MRYYEIIFMIHPNQNNQIQKLIEDCKNIIHSNNGKLYRLENWGKRKLSYLINNLDMAYYILLNIKVSKKAISEIESIFRFNTSVIRSMILRTKKKVISDSPIMKIKRSKEYSDENLNES